MKNVIRDSDKGAIREWFLEIAGDNFYLSCKVLGCEKRIIQINGDHLERCSGCTNVGLDLDSVDKVYFPREDEV